MLFYNSKPKINNVKINLYNNKQIFLKIAHLPDLHFNGIWTYDLDLIIEQLNELNLDLVVYNGDLFNEYNNPNVIEEIKQLSNINTKYGVFYTIGNREGRFEYNSDIFFDLNIVKNKFESAKLNLLEDIIIKKNKQIINIIGVSDIHSDTDNYYNHINKINNKKLIDSIIFCHNPIIQNDLDLKKLKNNLIISGHTHGAQIFPFGYIKLEKGLKKFNSKRKGLNKLKNNNQIFIGNGVGFNHSNFRLFSRNHIDILNIY